MLRRVLGIIRLLLLALIVAVLLLFVVNNHGSIAISLFPLPYEAHPPLFLLTIVFFVAGVLMGGLMMSLKLYRLKRAVLLFRRRADALENELKASTPAPTNTATTANTPPLPSVHD